MPSNVYCPAVAPAEVQAQRDKDTCNTKPQPSPSLESKWPYKAWHGVARRGPAWHGTAWRGTEWHGLLLAWCGTASSLV
eukprot:11171695-Lingulodinium_polyedra.AAC.1